MIKIENLSKSFNDHQIFDSISLQLNQGEVCSIIGPSGTGKSTFLRCLNLLETPDQGSITIGGKAIDLAHASSKDKKFLREKISMVFQNFNLFRNKTAKHNISELLISLKKMNKKEAEAKAERLLAEVGLAHRLDSYPITLSGGEQQRVGIARAMAMESDIILFDEPTSALDPSLVHEVLEVIKNLTEKKVTMLIVTHEMRFAKDISDTIVFLADGKITEQGPPEQIFNNPQEERTKEFLSSIYL